MGYQKLSEQEERQMVEEYLSGCSVTELMAKYGFKTKKSIADKVKKYYPDTYKEKVAAAQAARKRYSYSLETITSPFDAYLVGLLLTDGYVLTEGQGVGIDMTDEDVISFVAKTIGVKYKTYDQEGRRTKYRALIFDPKIVENVARFGIIPNKSLILPAPQLKKEEEKYLPYIFRGIIDGDGCVAPTSYGGSQFYIVSMSKEFILWCKETLEEKLFLKDLHLRQSEAGLWRVESALQTNILKLIALVYDKPFGMERKYKELRKTFRDYNGDFLLEDGIVQTATDNPA